MESPPEVGHVHGQKRPVKIRLEINPIHLCKTQGKISITGKIKIQVKRLNEHYQYAIESAKSFHTGISMINKCRKVICYYHFSEKTGKDQSKANAYIFIKILSYLELRKKMV